MKFQILFSEKKKIINFSSTELAQRVEAVNVIRLKLSSFSAYPFPGATLLHYKVSRLVFHIHKSLDALSLPFPVWPTCSAV